MTRSVIFAGLLCCCVWWITGCDTAEKAPGERQEPSKTAEQVVAETQQTLDRLNGKTIEEKVDPMDGSRRYYLSLVASEGDGILVVRCSSPKNVEAYLSFHNMVDSNDGRSAVRVKFDEQPPSKQLWTESKDYEALFTPNTQMFLKQLASSKRLMFEHSKFHGGTEITTFTLPDFHEGLGKLSRACQLGLPSS